MKEVKIIILGLLFVLLFSNLSFAETTCSRNNCDLVITIKIAFIGANDSYINSAKNEIESVWNGPTGNRIAGDCNCKVTFKVETKKLNQASCTPPPQGYHCVMVTPFFNASGGYADPPRNQTNMTNATLYIGYMYGIASGNGSNSQQGWWSDQMSQPVPGSATGEQYKDFAHEAGHMMGLEDGDGGIMNRTAGANSEPTQDNINEIVNDICGANACPDTCCCGNGKVDKDKGETCDPKVFPSGCTGGSKCCPVCCSCFARVCDPAVYAYLNLSDCESVCGADSKCYMNYKSGCYDCIKQNTDLTGSCLDPSNVRGNRACDHPIYDLTSEQIGETLLPLIGILFKSERININISGMGQAYVILQDGKVIDDGLGSIDDPTVLFTTDAKSVAGAVAGKLSTHQAIKDGYLKIEGVGFFNSFRIWFFLFLFKTTEPSETGYVPTPEEPFPEEYIKALDTGRPAPNDTSGLGLGDLPDLPYNK